MSVTEFDGRGVSSEHVRRRGPCVRLQLLGAVSILIGLCGAAHAEVLSVAATADNDFSIYVSDSPSVLGSLLLTDTPIGGADWVNTYSGSTSLSAGNYYVNIVAENWSGPGGMIASFSLGGKAFYTSNDGSWTSAYAPGGDGYVSNAASSWVSGPTGTVVSFGKTNDAYWYANGAFPHPGINPNAEWVWAGDPTSFPGTSPQAYNNACTGCTVEFQTTITAVPEPSTWAMLMLGFGGVGFAGYFRARKGEVAVASA